MGVLVVRRMPFGIIRLALKGTRPHTQVDQRFVDHSTSASDLLDPWVGWQLPSSVIGIRLWGISRRRLQVIAQFERSFHRTIHRVYLTGGAGARPSVCTAWRLHNSGISVALTHSIASQ
jgi:hypothetical protein